MAVAVDITGRRFGELIVIRPDPSPGRKNLHWLCRCDCGETKSIRGAHLRNGHIVSCGCKTSRLISSSKTSHGKSHLPEYGVWVAMKRRCQDPSDRAFKHYGGRGIFLSPEWEDFEAFLYDMGRRPSDRHSIERLDNDGPYSPENCVWAIKHQQVRNTRSSRLHSAFGQCRSLVDWFPEGKGAAYHTARKRLSLGWCNECAITIPPHGGTCPHR